MNVSTHIRELIDAIERFGPDAARTQRRALDKLIELDMVVNQEGLTRIWASTGVEDQRLHDRDALAAALKASMLLPLARPVPVPIDDIVTRWYNGSMKR